MLVIDQTGGHAGSRTGGRPSLRAELRELGPTLLTVATVVVALAVALAVGAAVHTSGPSGEVKVSEIEYRITMPTTLHAGRHTFVVTNDGTEPHEFVVFRTDLDARSLPRSDSKVDEASPLLHVVADSGSSFKPGESRSIPVTLEPGRYVALCNLPAHYGLGMRVEITVVR